MFFRLPSLTSILPPFFFILPPLSSPYTFETLNQLTMNEKGLTTATDPQVHDEYIAQTATPAFTDEKPEAGHATALNIVVNPLKVSFCENLPHDSTCRGLLCTLGNPC